MKPEIKIIDKLLPDDISKKRTSGQIIDTIVIHFMSDAIETPKSPYQLERIIKILKKGFTGHYSIDREGNIFRLVKENRIAKHAGKGERPTPPKHKDELNAYSIGIEIMAIGTQDEMEKAKLLTKEQYVKLDKEHIGFTDKQYLSLKGLINDIVTRNSNLEKDRNNIIGHDEYAKGRKYDPGKLFSWSRIGL